MKVPKSTAVWVPHMLHERVTFELKLPGNVRQEFSKQEVYPEENLPGYPTSGIRADPNEFESYEPAWIPGDESVNVAARHYYRYPFLMPNYPGYYKCEPRPPNEKNVDRCPDASIPGTDLTKAQLNDKVMSQIMENKMLLENKRQVYQEPENEQRLLKKRGTIKENTLRKSVTFVEQHDKDLSDIEAEYESGDLEHGDSGRGSADDLYLSDVEGDIEKRDASVGTDSSLLKRQIRKCRPGSGKKAPWRYWNTDPAPDLIEPMHYGPYRVGPYEPWLEPPPLETRCVQRGEYGGVYNST